MFSQPMKSFKAQVVKQFIGVMVVISKMPKKALMRPASSASVWFFRSSTTLQIAQDLRVSLVRSFRT